MYVQMDAQFIVQDGFRRSSHRRPSASQSPQTTFVVIVGYNYGQ